MADLNKVIKLDIQVGTGQVTQFEGTLEQVIQKIEDTKEATKDFRDELGKPIEVNVEINGVKQSAKDVENLTNELKQLKTAEEAQTKAAKDVNASFDEVYGDLKPLTARLGEAEDRLYELALAGQQTTQEYQDLLAATANYRRTQIETDLAVDAASQTFAQKLGGSLQAVAGAFAIAQGAAGLFGSENEDLEKAILKTQQALALVQGIDAFKQGLPSLKAFAKEIGLNTVLTKANAAANALTARSFKLMGISVETTSLSFKALKGAIAATGIGLLVVALGELVANFDKIQEFFGGATQAQKDFNAAVTEGQTKIYEESQAINANVKVLNDQNASLEVKKEAYKQLQEDVPALRDYTYEEAVATGVLTKAINLQIEAIKARAFAEVFAKKAAEEAGKQAEINNRTTEESLSFYDKTVATFATLFSAYGSLGGQYVKVTRAAKNNAEETEKSVKAQQIYTGEFEKYTKLALEAEAQLAEIEKAGTDNANKKKNATKNAQDADAKYREQQKKNAKAAYDEAVLQANKQRDLDLAAAKTAEERVAAETKYIDAIKVAKDNLAKANFKATEKEKRDANALALELYNIDKEAIDGKKTLNDEIKKLNEDRALSEQERIKKFKELTANASAQDLDNLEKSLQGQLDAIDESNAEEVQKAKELRLQLLAVQKQKALDAEAARSTGVISELEKQRDEELKLYEGQAVKQKQIAELYNAQIEAEKKQSGENIVAITQEYADQGVQVEKDAKDKKVELSKEEAEEKKDLQQQVFDKSVELANALADLAQAILEVQTKRIEDEYEKRKNDQERLNDKLTSNEELTAEQRAELERRNAEELTKIEEEKAAKLKEVKKKQADIDLAITTANIIAQTAQAVISVNASPAVNADVTQTLRTILTALVIGIGAAQLATAVAQRQAIQGLARGGMVYGPGTETSDDIPVLLSNGEAVINAAAVKRFSPILSAINESTGGAPIRPKFAAGGVIAATPGQVNISNINDIAAVAGQSAIRAYILSSDVASDSVKNSRLVRQSRIK